MTLDAQAEHDECFLAAILVRERFLRNTIDLLADAFGELLGGGRISIGPDTRSLVVRGFHHHHVAVLDGHLDLEWLAPRGLLGRRFRSDRFVRREHPLREFKDDNDRHRDDGDRRTPPGTRRRITGRLVERSRGKTPAVPINVKEHPWVSASR